MYLPGYHHNGFVASDTNGRIRVTLCAQIHELPQSYYFHDYIYDMLRPSCFYEI